MAMMGFILYSALNRGPATWPALVNEAKASMTLTVAFSASDSRLNQFCSYVKVEPGSVTSLGVYPLGQLNAELLH